MGGFVICALAQMIVLLVVNAQFKKGPPGAFSATKAGLEVWLLFIPAMTFGLLCDIEIIW